MHIAHKMEANHVPSTSEISNANITILPERPSSTAHTTSLHHQIKLEDRGGGQAIAPSPATHKANPLRAFHSIPTAATSG